MTDIETLKTEIIECLTPVNPEKVVLFGSYANGTVGKDSDIDLYVVTKDDFIPQNYQEKREIVRKISRALMALRMKVSLDLMVHTQQMSQKFYAMNSWFAKEIREKGIRLI